MTEAAANELYYTETLKKGSYGEVSLVKMSYNPNFHQHNRVIDFIIKILSANQTEVQRPFNTISLANSILHDGKVWKNAVENIPCGDSPQKSRQLASILVDTTALGKQIKESVRYKTFPIPFSTGICLSDFLEIIPSPVAARIVYAASDPNIARDLLMGEDLNGLHFDSQSLAIEAISLMPQATRLEIFKEMAGIEPRPINHTRRFLDTISVSWGDSRSLYCIPTLIKANLDNNFSNCADTKITEVLEDLPLLRKVVNN